MGRKSPLDKLAQFFGQCIGRLHPGSQHNEGYCPLGQGKVDLVRILTMMNESQPNADVMVELDGSPNMPYTPKQTAEISKAFLQQQGYQFRA